MKRVLILGSGYVSGPVVEYLTRDPGTQVTVGEEEHWIIHSFTCSPINSCVHEESQAGIGHFMMTLKVTYFSTRCECE